MYQMLGAAALFGGLQARNSAKQENEIKRVNYINALNDNVATNQAIDEANLTNTIRTGFRVGILNVQRGQARKEAAASKFQLSTIAQNVLGAATANAAAAGTIGSSLNAVESDIKKRSEEALIEAQANFETTQFNFDTQLNDIVQAGQDALQRSRIMDYSGVSQKSLSSAFLSGAIQATAQVGMAYMGAQMGLGLGGSGMPSSVQMASTQGSWATSGNAGISW